MIADNVIIGGLGIMIWMESMYSMLGQNYQQRYLRWSSLHLIRVLLKKDIVKRNWWCFGSIQSTLTISMTNKIQFFFFLMYFYILKLWEDKLKSILLFFFSKQNFLFYLIFKLQSSNTMSSSLSSAQFQLPQSNIFT